MIVLGESRTNITSLEKLRELANFNEIDAIFDLSQHYIIGDIVGKDFYYAIDLLNDIANKGDAIAQRVLGNIYLEGEGLGKDSQGKRVKRNVDLGMSLLRQAADGGDVFAQSQFILQSKNATTIDDGSLSDYKHNVINYVATHKYRSGIVAGLIAFIIINIFGIYMVYRLMQWLIL